MLVATLAILSTSPMIDREPRVETSISVVAISARDLEVTDPESLKKVLASVSYSLTYTGTTSRTGEPVPTITLRGRPESKPNPVLLNGLSTSLISEVEVMRQSQSVSEILGKAYSLGAPMDIGDILGKGDREFNTKLNETFNVTTTYPLDDLKPGGWTTRVYGRVPLEGTVKLDLSRTVTIGDRKPYIEPVLSGTYKNWTGWAPVGVIRETFEADPGPNEPLNYPVEQIGGLRIEKSQNNKMASVASGICFPSINLEYGQGASASTTINSTQYLGLLGKEIGLTRMTGLATATGYTPVQFNKLINGFTASGSGMNQLTFSDDPWENFEDYENPCSGQSFYPEGTLWLPSEPGYQPMMSYMPGEFRFIASVEGGYEAGKVSVRTHCLNINLKEPAEHVRYFPFRPSDPVLPRLAALSAASMLKGPWDQARTWIYTDRAAFSEINKRLIPGVSGGHYINGVFDVVGVGGISRDEILKSKLLDATTLGNGFGKPAAVQWYLAEMLHSQDDKMAAWLNTKPERLVSMLRDKDKDISGQAGMIIAACLADNDAKVRAAGLALVETLTKDDLAPVNKWQNSIRSGAMGASGSETDLWIALAESGKITIPREALGFIAIKGSESAKAKAKAMFDAAK